jgi:hypothetical protein
MWVVWFCRVRDKRQQSTAPATQKEARMSKVLRLPHKINKYINKHTSNNG